jgi:hypothetical protein
VNVPNHAEMHLENIYPGWKKKFVSPKVDNNATRIKKRIEKEIK